MKRVCLRLPSLDERGDKWPIDCDVAQAVYTVKSSPNHVWSNPYIHPPHSHEGSHLLSRVDCFLKM